ncbi:putative (E,E)-geranyllinalool synthase-like [Capsicum annuum]|nr:putative (E,E)-geranyllinalool synthase-like [Capsicum annuum]
MLTLSFNLPHYFPRHNYNSIPTIVSLSQPSSFITTDKSSTRQTLVSVFCRARRRVIYDNDNEEEDEDNNNNNVELAMLEFYSQSMRNEALLVKAIVDEEEVEVLIFKGFSSCLSYRTSSDPSKSVLPARAVIKCIDRIKGPFDPSNIVYLEKGLNFESFKDRILSKEK